MTHTVMIVLYATAGVAAFVAGCLVLAPPSDEQRARRLLEVYLVALGLMIAFMLGAMLVHWQQLGTGQQLIFGGLFLLGLYMGWRALSARRLLHRRSEGWRLPYMEHVGFTLIALWEAFVIVLAIDLARPAGWSSCWRYSGWCWGTGPCTGPRLEQGCCAEQSTGTGR